MFRSFFLAVHGNMELEFKPASLLPDSFMQGSFKDFDFTIREFKIFKGTGKDEHEMFSEEETYNNRLTTLKNIVKGFPLSQYASKLPLLQGLPLSPFPKYQRCLGLTPYMGVMEIMDRYMRVGFNVKLLPADESCLYADFETAKDDPMAGGFFKNFNLADMAAGYAKLMAAKKPWGAFGAANTDDTGV
jgi:hypothetical protein